MALLGPNGAGKSTAISMLLGLVAPDAETVEVFGDTPPRAMRAGKVGELVSLVGRLYPRPLAAEEVLATAGLNDLTGRRVDGLSGGRRQRVRFALALAGGPDLLVLDEPTAAMDVESRRAFWTGMRAQAAAGRTILFPTRDLEEADENADRIVVLAAGRVVADGPGTQIRSAGAGRTVSFDLAGEPAHRKGSVLSLAWSGRPEKHRARF